MLTANALSVDIANIAESIAEETALAEDWSPGRLAAFRTECDHALRDRMGFPTYQTLNQILENFQNSY